MSDEECCRPGCALCLGLGVEYPGAMRWRPGVGPDPFESVEVDRGVTV